jgi:hypothetical protein
MASINLFDPAAWIYRHGLAVAQWPFRAAFGLELPSHSPVHLTMDPTDLLTLPALLIPWLLATRRYVISSATATATATATAVLHESCSTSSGAGC